MSDAANYLPDHPPVTDWVNDFDHTDPRWTEDPFPIWEELRGSVWSKSFTQSVTGGCSGR